MEGTRNNRLILTENVYICILQHLALHFCVAVEMVKRPGGLNCFFLPIHIELGTAEDVPSMSVSYWPLLNSSSLNVTFGLPSLIDRLQSPMSLTGHISLIINYNILN